MIEFLVFLGGYVLLGSLPDGNHRVKRFLLGDGFVLGLVAGFGAFLSLCASHIHNDGVADVVAVFLYELGNSVLLQKLAVVLVLGVLFDSKGYDSSDGVLLGFLDCVAVSSRGAPNIRGVAAVLFGLNLNLVGNHKRGVEAYAELTDDVHVVDLLVLLFEAIRA